MGVFVDVTGRHREAAFVGEVVPVLSDWRLSTRRLICLPAAFADAPTALPLRSNS